MTYFESLATEALGAHTLAVLAAALLTFALSKRAGPDRPRHRTVLFFVGGHLLCLAATAAFSVVDSPLASVLRTPAWVFGAVGAVGALASLLFNALLPSLRLTVPLILQDVLVGIAMVAASLAVLSRSGVNLSGLIATSAVFTAILGFSVQDVISNIAGGLALQVDGSIGTGDWIKVNDVLGRVVEVRWKHTALETRNWETVLIPNSSMTRSNVVILGRRQGHTLKWRVWRYLEVDLEHTPGEVIEVIETALRQAHFTHVAREPAPNVVLTEVKQNFARYGVRFWVTNPEFEDLMGTEVHTYVMFVLKRAGMPLALPTQVVQISQGTEGDDHARLLQRCRDLLRKVDIFADLSAEQLEELARHTTYAPFARNEVMTRQGAVAHWLYLLEDGVATVQVSDGTSEKEAAQIRGPSFFGEMSLLTGEPRTATVIALTKVECFRLDKVALQRLLHRHPELAEHMARVMSERLANLRSVREELDATTRRTRTARDTRDLLARIRSFFELS